MMGWRVSGQERPGPTRRDELQRVDRRAAVAPAARGRRQQGATWIVAEGADSSGNERSIPMAKAMDDVLVAYGQNGEAVRPENGYPLRLIVPAGLATLMSSGCAASRW